MEYNVACNRTCMLWWWWVYRVHAPASHLFISIDNKSFLFCKITLTQVWMDKPERAVAKVYTHNNRSAQP